MSLQSILDDLEALEAQLDDEAESNGKHYFALRDALKNLRLSQSIIRRVNDDDAPPDTDLERSDWRERVAAMKPEIA